MFASLLPGLRELRAPLAAGYLWLIFAYLIAGSPTTVNEAPSAAVRDLLMVLPELGKAATAIAISFVAYLVGSVSQDLFRQIMPRRLRRLSMRFPRQAQRHHDLRSEIRAMLDRAAPIEVRDLDRRIRRVAPLLEEMRAAGASQTERPEALRPMVEAEENLRVAIVPPLLAVLAALALTDSHNWLVGLAFAIALFAQSVMRREEAADLAARHYRGRDAQQVERQLREIADKLINGILKPDQALKDLDAVPLHRLLDGPLSLQEEPAGANAVREPERPS